VAALLDVGAPLLDFAEEHDLPLLIHTSPVVSDAYSQTADVFRVIAARPRLRFCLAHCLLFYRDYLAQAGALPNVWVDTAALKIQVDSVRTLRDSGGIPIGDLIDDDLSDYRRTLADLCAAYPDTIVWGTDSPAYVYICRRQDAADGWVTFNLKGRYEDEVAGLRSLPAETQRRIAGANTLDFLFGRP
jgi:predicted TIM-barrel fold metal-dependent hydrolase